MKEFDFGFSVVSDAELSKDKEAELARKNTFINEKLLGMYNMIMPLLNNLKSNPEKDYIHWPNRKQKIDEFITSLNIYMHNNKK